MKGLLIVVPLLVALFAGLVAMDILPAPWADDSAPSGPEGPGSLLTGTEGEEGEGTVLHGSGEVRERSMPEAPPDPLEGVPAVVEGSRLGGASITGRVVTAKGGVPVDGAEVRLVRPDSIFHYLRAEPKGRFDTLVARSDADGRFAFRSLVPSGGYVVRVKRAPHATASTRTLDLRGGERVDVGVIEMHAGGSIAGRVIDADGSPVANVRVAAGWAVVNQLGVALADPDTMPEIERETVTAEDGTYRLEGLEPGAKTITVKAPSGASEMLRRITVVRDQVAEAEDIQLAGEGVIAGQIVWSSGDPIQGARVFGGPDQTSALRTMDTGADGRFELRNLPEGMQVIGVLVPGSPVHLEMGVELGRTDVRIEFPEQGSLRVVVKRASDGEPVASYSLATERTDLAGFQAQFIDQIVRRAIGPIQVDAENGSYLLRGIGPGAYAVTVEAPGFPAMRQAQITVAAGGAPSEVEILLPEGNALSGTVTLPDGTPAASARIFAVLGGALEAVEATEMAEVFEDEEPQAAAAADGTFRIPTSAPGTYDLVVLLDGRLPAHHQNVDLSEGDVEGIEIEMPPSATVRGLILGEGARPAAGERWYVLYPDGTLVRGESGEDGRFERTGLPAGNCLVRFLSMRDARRYGEVVTARDEEAREAAYNDLLADGGEVRLVDGGEIHTTLNVPRRVLVRATLRFAEDAARHIPGVWIAVPGVGIGNWIEFDEHGQFEQHIEAGTYDLWLPNLEGNWQARTIEIPDAASYNLDLTPGD